MIAEAMTLEGALFAAVGALCTAVVFLFQRMERVNQRHEKALEECQSDRRVLWERIAKLEALSCTIERCKLRTSIGIPPEQ